jgi:hypothetical protein
MKDSFNSELKHVFDKLPEYHIQVMLAVFNAKVGRKDISNQ